jgi:energy-coupling factor transporter ATP-binding protein EcfA2
MRKSFGARVAVAGVDIHVRAGEIVGLLGVSGSGKSTIFNMITGLVRPDAGTFHVGGRDVSGASVDARARLLFSGAALSPRLGQGLRDGDVAGYATLGWFVVNPTYGARPDNSGLALFRYAAHSELSLWHRHVALGLDGTFFSDRKASNPVRPSELDLTGELIGRAEPFEVHVAYERDMPLDKSGLVQSLLYVVVAYGFDFHDALHAPPPAPSQPGRQ